MIVVDFIGLVFTLCLVGLRYPHYALVAMFIHETGRILMAVFLHQKIDLVVAAGAFGKTVVGETAGSVVMACIALGGPLANYIISVVAGGIEYEKTTNLLNPAARLKCPVSVINLRLAVISFFLSLIQFI
ncbi:putative membrane protein [Propionispora sp. 2/2-37]|uniref:hypothetical protein n=1 Tax=Propionispora sp. 2/2-37 TaxID=1677858 RepID=UPI0006BB9542|nr:hypothetical protein [Propionispora sp. 2/2-37]CUH94061.1 putative membrane protein [Propionispora sp. 2/2-37]